MDDLIRVFVRFVTSLLLPVPDLDDNLCNVLPYPRLPLADIHRLPTPIVARARDYLSRSITYVGDAAQTLYSRDHPLCAAVPACIPYLPNRTLVSCLMSA
jgi:hypothetical protein